MAGRALERARDLHRERKLLEQEQLLCGVRLLLAGMRACPALEWVEVELQAPEMALDAWLALPGKGGAGLRLSDYESDPSTQEQSRDFKRQLREGRFTLNDLELLDPRAVEMARFCFEGAQVSLRLASKKLAWPQSCFRVNGELPSLEVAARQLGITWISAEAISRAQREELAAELPLPRGAGASGNAPRV